VRELVDVAASQYEKHSKKIVCKVLGIKLLRQEIIRIYHEQDGVYGAPKIRQEINQLNLPFAVSEKRVQRIMKSLGLRSVVIKKYRPYKADAVYNEGENSLKRDFSTTKKNGLAISRIYTLWWMGGLT